MKRTNAVANAVVSSDVTLKNIVEKVNNMKFCKKITYRINTSVHRDQIIGI